MKTLTEKFERLSALGFDVPTNVIVNSKEQIAEVFKHETTYRKELDYDIDGLVIAVDNIEAYESFGYQEEKMKPKGSIALKFKPEEILVTIKDIEWSFKGGSYASPVAIFDSVELLGARISRVHAKSYQWMLDNACGVGSVVSLVRSGDVIPKITKVVVPTEHTDNFKLPKTCPFCGSSVVPEGARLKCSSSACYAKQASKIAKFLKVWKVKGLGWKTLLEYTKSGVTLLDFVSLNFEKIDSVVASNEAISNKVWLKIKSQMKEKEKSVN